MCDKSDASYCSIHMYIENYRSEVRCREFGNMVRSFRAELSRCECLCILWVNLRHFAFEAVAGTNHLGFLQSMIINDVGCFRSIYVV